MLCASIRMTDLDWVVGRGLGAAHLPHSLAELPGFLKHQVGAEHLVKVRRPREVPQTQGYQAVNINIHTLTHHHTWNFVILGARPLGLQQLCAMWHKGHMAGHQGNKLKNMISILVKLKLILKIQRNSKSIYAFLINNDTLLEK